MSRQQLVDRQRKERLWEQKQMHNGHMAQVVAYRNAQDIDVLIDNRITVEHTTYQRFKKGSMTPGYPKKQHSHIGETVLMHNGLTAEIIAYRCVGDIDVRFSDGTIVEHKTYSHFCSGHMLRPGEKEETLKAKK